MALPRFFVRASNLVKIAPVFNSHSSKINPKYVHTSSSTLAARLFTEKHEWVEINDKIGIVGISQYAQEALGDVVYAQLPDVDTIVKQNEECGALESVKAASEIYSPVSGKVIEKNVQVEDTPSLINTSCYDKGWLFKVELTDNGEAQALMTEDKYKEFLKTQEHH
ncbi:glycine cleavage system H protein, mitochondrial [Anoplophora glabripennis]|uniref:glycine cleavage system H protein, mitochondrial n=1 Tax=Anoplophora glabripennis TaxID=217634 RepID=UPI000874C838|nr:glycine cleavage system H protein, mitochondrial [Anoplophora glabripennis]